MTKNLFDTVRLRTTTLRNRVWRSGTWLAAADNEGGITDTIVDTYSALAAGGAALLVTGLTSISATDEPIGGECKFYDDRFVPGHRRLTDTVHSQGARILLQTAMVNGLVDELSTAQVDALVKQFGLAALRAERAGYDGVQIHAAHFFYLSRFVSPLFNHRTDKYADALILPAIVEEMRSLTAPDFIITAKVNSTDCYPGGVDTDYFIDACCRMARSGIDAIEVSANGTSRQGIVAGVNEGSFLAPAARLAEAVEVPVALVGGLRSLPFIQQVLDTTGIEYISLSRPLVCEPALVNRWQGGDHTPSRCVSCNSCYSTPHHQCVMNLRR